MSIKIMSAIFATDFKDLKDAAGTVTKASTVTLVLLALADHASENGEGAYPSLSKMMQKTKLARTTILQAYKALMYNGIIKRVGRSKFRTSNYTIHMDVLSTTRKETSIPAGNMEEVPVRKTDQSSHCTNDSPATLPVQPLHQSSHCTNDSPATLPSSVQPLDLNHPLTTIKPSREIDSAGVQKVWAELEKLCGAVALDTARLIDVWIEKHALERILQAIGVARDRGARSPKYVDQVLITWEANGYPKTREELIAERRQYAPPSRAARRANDATAALQAYILEHASG